MANKETKNLRPISSMTEEEFEELEKSTESEYGQLKLMHWDKVFDWLDEHGFEYRK